MDKNPDSLIKINNLKNKIKKYKDFQKVSYISKILYNIFPSLYIQNSISKRAVFISPNTNNNDNDNNFYGFSNKVTNTKYNFLSFIPLVILNQFRLFGNQFYLLMSLSQFIEIFKVGFLFSYLSPLLIVLFFTLITQLYDEIKCYLQDRKINKEEYTKITYDSVKKILKKNLVEAQDIKTGDILEIKNNQRAPADLILLNNKITQNIYIKTTQLDGETDLKNRKILNILYKNFKDFVDIYKNNNEILIEYDPPNKNIYEFKGVLSIINNEKKTLLTEALSLENTLWESTILASSNSIGIVIYTGKDSKAQMNLDKKRYKIGKLDLEINYYNKLLFIIMVILSLIIIIFKKGSYFYKFICFCRFIVLFCGIIPISLKLNLDISKKIFAFQINSDNDIQGTFVRNSNFPEDLGRISYIFSDKTGTLTKNEMHLKFLAINQKIYNVLKEENIIKNAFRDNSDNKLVNTLISMGVCNNVTPIKNNNIFSFQGNSPDEIALVEYLHSINIDLIKHDDKKIEIKLPNNDILEYEILNNFPFSSETKRMGIILRNNQTKEIEFHLKGAELVMQNFIEENKKELMLNQTNELAKKGLRTLVLSYKKISLGLYNEFMNKYNLATCAMENRNKKIQESISFLEKDMELLCVTGVEDLLQDNIKNTINDLTSAGIKIWMLTGDKAETAKCISVSTGLKKENQEIYCIINEFYKNNKNFNEDLETTEKRLIEYRNLLDINPEKYLLLIEGEIISLCLNENIKDLFFNISMKAPNVICCRCGPSQKAQIVQKIKKYLGENQRTLAIGDGGNDVSMILQADVGVGIEGKEGLQAALSSDFSIKKFCYLNNLLIWWGRVAYKNTAKMSLFVMYRGLIISLIQFIFSILFYFNSIALYNGMLILGYSTFYTTPPALSLLLDVDKNYYIKRKKYFPFLYKIISKGKELSIKNFIFWANKSIFQSVLIVIGSVNYQQENVFLKIVTITFSELIITEVVTACFQIEKFNYLIAFGLLGTLGIYIFSVFTFKNILDVSYVFEKETLKCIFVISSGCLIPIFILNSIEKKIYPNAIMKIEKIEEGIIKIKKIVDYIGNSSGKEIEMKEIVEPLI